ncbi:MAG: squalene--hopene cyclase [Alphaproteobacteria bacterium]
MNSLPAFAPAESAGESAPDLDAVAARVATATDGLLALQKPDGEWCFELEADATIPAEYILLGHFLGAPEPEIEAKLSAYLRRIQGADGGWPLFHGAVGDVSATVKAYYALKLAGDDPTAPHMARARAFVLGAGGAARSNVFTRIALALFRQVPWRAVPAMPVEIMLLPRWSPFHLGKVSYWSRTVIVPLLVLMVLKPAAANPKAVDIAELFRVPPDEERDWMGHASGNAWGRFFLALDRAVRAAEPLLPRNARQRAIDVALAFMRERLNGDDGLGGIFPAMANAVMAYAALGRPAGDPDRAIAMAAVRKLLVLGDVEGYCQPCLSPVWDTGLAMHALMEAGITGAPIDRAAEWLLDRQILDLAGDWAQQRPDLRPGGWAFQYRNDHYPDVDDTAVVALALHRSGLAGSNPRVTPAIARAVEWIEGIQSRNGGWGAFDADNVHYRLNHIPFADHGALLDPPTVDVTARCLACLGGVGRGGGTAAARGIEFVRRDQETDGSWFGRWGTNYIYGTWSVLTALNALGHSSASPMVERAVGYLLAVQRGDGGWGEDGATYWADRRGAATASTPSQTAWALLGLMAAGEVDHPAVGRGVRWLLEAPAEGAFWSEAWYTAVGFPRVFYLRYHGYRAYFPLWALARYLRLRRGGTRKVLDAL